jgi:hypothetical protein
MALQWKMFVYYTGIRSILRPFDIFYGHLVYFMVIWNIFPRVGTLNQEKNLATLIYFEQTHWVWSAIGNLVDQKSGLNSIRSVIELPAKEAAIKVTRLGEFSPFGWQLTVGIFLKI